MKINTVMKDDRIIVQIFRIISAQFDVIFIELILSLFKTVWAVSTIVEEMVKTIISNKFIRKHLFEQTMKQSFCRAAEHQFWKNRN